MVTVDELVTGVTIALGTRPLDACPAFDADQNQQVTVNELVIAVNNALVGCPSSPTPTVTPSPVVTQNGSPTAMSTSTPSRSPPTLNAIRPMSGPPGSSVTIMGTHLDGASAVTFNGTAASFSSLSASEITATVPVGAVSGPIGVTTSAGSATTADVFAVLAKPTFGVSLSPSIAAVIQGQSTALTATLVSGDGFARVAALDIAGLPAGVTATITPSQITAGQSALITVTAPPGQAPGMSNVTVTAAASVLGIQESASASATLTVEPLTTAFLGRTVVDDATQTALAGVAISFLGRDGSGGATGCHAQTVSDAAGNFAFTDLPDQCVGSQLVSYDGSTATAPPGRYAGVNLIYMIVAHQAVVSPVLVHLPRIDDRETVMVSQNAAMDRTFTFSTIPFLSVTVYAGTIFTLPNGTQPDPFPLTAVEVPIDRLPEEFSPQAQSSNSILAFIVAFQPANAVASQPVAVTFPNTLGTRPGLHPALYTLDPTRGQMVPYGSGSVSDDGTQIVPDADPAHPGHAFGLVHFDWHGSAAPPKNQTNTSPQNTSTPNNNNGPPRTSPPSPSNCAPVCDQPSPVGEPIDVSSGLEILTATDVALPGLRGGLFIQRTYRTGTTNPGPFGIGSGHNFAYQLTVAGAGVVNLVVPDGNQFPFNLQPDGTFTNATVPSLLGAVLRNPGNGVYDIRWKEGTTYEFRNVGPAIVLTSIRDSNGNTTTLIYGNQGAPAQLTEIVDPVGRALTFQYDGSGRITSITDPLNRVVQYAYNGQGTLATVIDAAGGITAYDYDAQNRLTKVTDARGVVMAQNAYDQNGRVSSQTLADGGVYTFAYTVLNPLLSAVSPVLRTVVTDPLGNATSYRFNAQGFVTGITDATGQTRFFERAPGTNLVLAVTGTASCPACGDTVTFRRSFTYDANGNVLTTTDALGNTLTLTYDPIFNQLASLTDPLGQVVTIDYDDRGNAIRLTDATGTRTADFDAVGQLTRLTDSLGQPITFAYDVFGNITGLTDALGETTMATYDTASRAIQVTDTLGHTTTRSYDTLDRLTAITDAQQHTTSYTYDAVGNPLSVTDPLGNMTTYTWHPVGQLASLTTPLGKTETFTYDTASNLVAFADRRGQATQYAYDALNRLVTETFQDGSTVMRSYDANGQLVEANDSVSGLFSFTHDAAGRLLSSAGPFGAVQYTYDPVRRVTSRTVVGQAPVQYAYDGVGNLITATTQGTEVDLAYDARNALLSMSRTNGTTTAYGYDNVGRLLSVVHANGAVSLSQAYTYDAEGHRTSATTGAVQSLITPAVSNLFDANNRLVQSGQTAFTYDDAGDTTSAAGSEGTTTYTWDARGQLQSIVAPNGQRTDLLYDFAGRLISQTDAGPALNRVRNFVLDDLSNVALIEDSSGDIVSVMDGRAIDQHLAIIHGNGAVEYPLADAGNSTVATADQAGNILETFTYEPFGKTAANGSAFPFQFAGRVPIAGSLYSYRARYYDSALGRFISEDPIGFADFDANLYSVRDPVNFTDPLGFTPSSCQPVAKLVQIKAAHQGATRVDYRRRGSSRWYTAYQDQDLYVGDELRTDNNTLVAAEFVIGGRVGVNRNSTVQIVDATDVKQAGNPSYLDNLLNSQGFWGKISDAHVDPLEIQTSGGVMGDKG